MTEIVLGSIFQNLWQFRLVKFAAVRTEDPCWVLLRSSKSLLRLLYSRFTGRPERMWYGTNGRDRGAPGPYNYHLNRSCNHHFHLIYTLPEILAHELSGEWNNWHWFREDLPRTKIIAEINIAEAYQRMFREYGKGFDDIDFSEASEVSSVLRTGTC